ncbi:MAG: FHA domain-containing protein [Rhodobacterales bacterium]|nr:FHA domain-containing protein [Rhodobacterales bacterium]
MVQVAHDGRVSRFHCKRVVSGSRVHIEGNTTTNGTWVNGEGVLRRRLYGGEQIAVGNARFIFRAG